MNGGEGGIRTPDTLSGMAAFEAARFNRSRTSPQMVATFHHSGRMAASFYQRRLEEQLARNGLTCCPQEKAPHATAGGSILSLAWLGVA